MQDRAGRRPGLSDACLTLFIKIGIRTTQRHSALEFVSVVPACEEVEATAEPAEDRHLGRSVTRESGKTSISVAAWEPRDGGVAWHLAEEESGDEVLQARNLNMHQCYKSAEFL